LRGLRLEGLRKFKGELMGEWLQGAGEGLEGDLRKA